MNILAIGAHFDDIELGCGGTIARHVHNGDTVIAYVASRSGYTGYNLIEIRNSEVARQEGEAAMAILGAQLVHGRFPTFSIEFCEALNVEIVELVEKHNIDLVYTHWTSDIHHDHQAVGRASLHSCRHVPRLLMYRSNWYHSDKEFRGNFYVDISDYWDIKARAIEAHATEVARTCGAWINFFHNEALNAGQRIGVKFAEVFEMVKCLN